MVLAYNARAATRDVDALFEPREKVHDAAVEVATELGLPRWWLNDQATSYLSRLKDEGASLVVDYPNLRVTAISAEHLFAMKVLASRRYADIQDIRVLAERLGVTEVDEVEAMCAQIYPDEPLSARARLVVEDVLQQLKCAKELGQPSPPAPERSPAPEQARGPDKGYGLSL